MEGIGFNLKVMADPETDNSLFGQHNSFCGQSGTANPDHQNTQNFQHIRQEDGQDNSPSDSSGVGRNVDFGGHPAGSFTEQYNEMLEGERSPGVGDENPLEPRVSSPQASSSALTIGGRTTPHTSQEQLSLPARLESTDPTSEPRILQGPDEQDDSSSGSETFRSPDPQPPYSNIQGLTTDLNHSEVPFQSVNLESEDNFSIQQRDTDDRSPLVSHHPENDEESCLRLRTKAIAIGGVVLVCLVVAICLSIFYLSPSESSAPSTTSTTTPGSAAPTSTPTVSTTQTSPPTTTTLPALEACKNPVIYGESWRLDDQGSNIKPNTSHSKGGYACDFYGGDFWFKFTGKGGDVMRNFSLPTKSCGAYIPFWTAYSIPLTVGEPVDIEVYGVYTKPKAVIMKAQVMRCSWDTSYDVVYKYTDAPVDPCYYAFCGMKAPK